MRLIVALVLLLGVTLAGAAVYMAQGQIGQYQSERDQLLRAQQAMPPLADVVVLKHPVKYGERITAADLETVKMQADKLPEGVFLAVTAPQGAPLAPRAAFLQGETRSRAVLRSYMANEPLVSSKVTQPGVDAGITAALDDNMRAFTINVDVASGVSGFLRPGNQVDVYWSGTVGDQQVTKLIDSNLKLIAIDQSSDADRSEPTAIARTVTAEVTPEQVAALTLAQTTGRLTLSLVGMKNTAEVGAIEINRNDLLGIAPEEEKAAAPRVCTIKTRKGSDMVETPIPCTN